MSSKVTVSFKAKWLWLTLGIILILLALAPVISSYYPATSSSPSSGGSSGPTSSAPSSSSGGPAPNCPNPCTISIKNSVFGTGQTVVVKAGTTVTWVNNDDTVHTSTSDSGLWDSGIIQIGSSFSHTFSTAGTFPYHCNVHPMTGTIVVVS
jgi:plastocyanin